MSEKQRHVPDGDPCKKCRLSAARHRVETHRADGDPCGKCGAPASIHTERRLAPSDERRRKNRSPSPLPVRAPAPPREVPERAPRKRSRKKRPSEPHPWHNPVGTGDRCEKCGARRLRHRVRHRSQGDPCGKCGLPENHHKPAEYVPVAERRFFMGVDGEGTGRDDHRYVFLGAASADREVTRWIEREGGLSTDECLEFLISLPKDARFFAYSFNYDLTMMLRDLPDRSLYWLFRPDIRRRRRGGPWPVKYKDFWLNLQGSKFTIKRGKHRRVIWDIFKFYQSKFVTALEDWKAATPDQIERMKKMKDARAEFEKLYARDKLAVWEYCLDECAAMALLAEKLVEAHEEAGLELRSFYGAGSSGAAMLDAMGIKEEIVEPPEELQKIIAQAFFGGRFENSVIGREPRPVWNYDISSAYPYQLMFLPCLRCGRWLFTKSEKRARRAAAALVHYRLDAPRRKTRLNESWAPFPYRDDEGSISYPRRSPGGWLWGVEFFAGQALFPNAHFRGAWVYETECDHRPFEQIAKYYAERVRVGKEGKGIVLKLGPNSVYGKLAQSIGSAPFQCWVWAGLVTAGCRAQILEVLGLHRDPKNLLMIATDGVFSLEKIALPEPRDTGTAELRGPDGEVVRKPLGGWEAKRYDRGVFVARPGVYFPLSPTEAEVKTVRGRGVGKAVVLACWAEIVRAWEERGIGGSFEVTRVVRFCGAKSSITRHGRAPYFGYRRADGTKSANRYGQWVERSVEMSFDPMPKREGLAADGRSLLLREVLGKEESRPYDRAVLSKEARALREATEELLEQPDADFSDYAPEDG